MDIKSWDNFDWMSVPWTRHKEKNGINFPKFVNEYFLNRKYDVPIVGVDSQRMGFYTKYTVLVVLHKKNKGCIIAQKKVKMKNPNNLYEKLSTEVIFGLMAGSELLKLEVGLNPGQIPIHIDVNNNEKHDSAKHQKSLVGMVKAQGFKCVIKPDSWAATQLADKVNRK